ncbi:nucleotidyltransferase domain-containing protein [Nitrospira sp. M1]
MVDPTVVATIQNYLTAAEKQGVRVSQAILFGSYAKGTETTESDIDLLVIGPNFDPQPDRNVVGKLWGLRAETDIRIEPIPIGEQRWKNDDSDVIIEVARREGVPISLS